MALGNSTNATFLKVYDGKIVRTFKNATTDSKSRVNKSGNTVHEEFYDYVEGRITSITTKEVDDYGKFWVIKLSDNGNDYQLEFNYSGSVAASFLKALPNVDLTKPVRLSPKKTVDGDKTRQTLFINQDGKAAKWFWTKDNPGDLPGLSKVKVKGKETWDDSDQLEYLENYVKETILPQLNTAPVETTEAEDF
jgi:hypothetical protein